jgi:hypothetical protein
LRQAALNCQSTQPSPTVRRIVSMTAINVGE